MPVPPPPLSYAPLAPLAPSKLEGRWRLGALLLLLRLLLLLEVDGSLLIFLVVLVLVKVKLAHVVTLESLERVLENVLDDGTDLVLVALERKVVEEGSGVALKVLGVLGRLAAGVLLDQVVVGLPVDLDLL